MGSFNVTPEQLFHSRRELQTVAEDLRVAHRRVEGLRSLTSAPAPSTGP